VPLGANQTRDFRFHQRLRQHADAFAQDLAILLFQELANECRQIHSGLGHRRNTSVWVLLAEELTERCAMAAPAVDAAGLVEFPPRPGTLAGQRLEHVEDRARRKYSIFSA
jgi:hypothetical protein